MPWFCPTANSSLLSVPLLGFPSMLCPLRTSGTRAASPWKEHMNISNQCSVESCHSTSRSASQAPPPCNKDRLNRHLPVFVPWHGRIPDPPKLRQLTLEDEPRVPLEGVRITQEAYIVHLPLSLLEFLLIPPVF